RRLGRRETPGVDLDGIEPRVLEELLRPRLDDAAARLHLEARQARDGRRQVLLRARVVHAPSAATVLTAITQPRECPLPARVRHRGRRGIDAAFLAPAALGEYAAREQ